MAKKLENKSEFVFGKQNYMLLGLALVTIFLGFALMSGGGSEDPTEYNPEIFSTRRIVVAPVVVLIGYGLVIYAIMKRPAASKKEQVES